MIILAVPLAAVFCATGLGLTPADAAPLRTQPRPTIAALVLQLLLAPLLAIGVAFALGAPLPVAAGMMLAAMAPGGPAAHLLTVLAGGTLALARALTLAGTVAAAVTVPAIAAVLLAGGAGDIGFTLLLMLLPLLAGMSLRRLSPAFARHEGTAVTLASLATLVLAGMALWQAGFVGFGPALWVGMALVLALTALGRLLGGLMRLDEGGRVALALALPQRNLALPLAMTLAVGRPDVAQAVVAYGVAMWLLGLGLVALRLRRAQRG